MSDKELSDMGISAVGDRVKLRAFCQRQSELKDDKRAEMKRKLSAIMEASKSSRLSKTTAKKKEKTAPPTGARKATLKFEIWWKHYVKGFGYKAKRSEQGGGVRNLDLPRHATPNECLLELKKIFFPDGQSLVGKADDMEFKLADFKCQTIYMCDDFSPERYKQRYGLHTPRLFLLSRDGTVSSEESDDEELKKSPFEDSRSQEPEELVFSVKEKNQPVAACLSGASAEPLVHSSFSVEHAMDGLIGTSEERRVFIDQLQADYEASLASDKEKELDKEESIRIESLQMSRMNRVLPEPALQKPRVMVSVRHPTLGVIRRAFPPNCTVMALYDWVGSLSTRPEHFAPCFSSPYHIVCPEDDIKSVTSSVHCMSEQQFSISLCRDDDEVAVFNAQPDTNDSVDDTLSDYELEAATEYLNGGVAANTYKQLE